MNIIPSYPRLNETIKDAMLLTSGVTFIHLLSKKLAPSLSKKWTPSGYPLWVGTSTVGAALGREFFMLIQKGFSSESERTTNFLYCTGKDQTFPAKFLHSLLQIGGIALAFFFMTSPRCKQYLSKYGSLSLLPIGTSVVIGSAIVLLCKSDIGDYDDKEIPKEEFELNRGEFYRDQFYREFRQQAIEQPAQEFPQGGRQRSLSNASTQCPKDEE